MPNVLRKFMQLTKVDVAKNLIYGTFTAEVLDKSGEIADYHTTKLAIQTWSADMLKTSGGKSKGNIRLMHGDKVAGIAKEINYYDDEKVIHGCVEVKPEITEDAAKGLLNGFSIGGTYARKWDDPVHKGHQRFTPVISEISIVDNPCVPIAIFDAIKDASFVVVGADGVEAMHKFAPKKIETEQGELAIEEVFKAADGSEHKTRELAKAKNDQITAAKTADPALKVVEKLEALANDDPAAAKEALKKSMHHVAALADVVNNLHQITKSHEAQKGEGNPVTAKLKKHVRGLSDTLGAMAQDEGGEMNEEHAAKVTGAIKIGQDLAKEAPVVEEEFNKGLLKDAMENIKTRDTELAKVASERDELKKTLDEMQPRLEKAMDGIEKRLADQAAMIKKISEQPAGATGGLFIVEKDGKPGEAKPVTLSHQSPADFVRMNS